MALLRNAGIQLHQGKTTWHPKGINVLGTPIGSGHFITQKMEERMEKERDLWRAIPTVLDLQCSWQLLLQSANPRANHTMRTLPPSQSPAYCQAHDEVMCWVKSQPRAKTTPGSFPHCQCEWADWGCVRLRCAPAAFWASWADALPMIAKRIPEVASEVMQKLSACLSSTQLPTHWTGKAFIGDQAGLICTTARDQSAAFGTRASGHTAGSIGLLPS